MRLLPALAVAAVLALPAEAGAQVTLRGVVTEDSTGRPVSGVEVGIENPKRSATTDASGSYTLADLPAGVRMVTARKLGYLPSGMIVQLSGTLVERNLQIARTPTVLDTMKATAPHPLTGRYAFDERRKLGLGRFLDSAATSARANASVADVLAAESGIRVVMPPLCRPAGPRMTNCSGTATKRVAVSSGLCSLRIVQDGAVLGTGGQIDDQDYDPSGRTRSNLRPDMHHDWPSAFDLTSLNMGNVVAMEVYRRGSEVPMEFQGPNTECGLVVLWTQR